MNTSPARKEPHQVSEEGGGRGGYFAEEAYLPLPFSLNNNRTIFVKLMTLINS